MDLASVSWPCLVAATPCQREGSRIAFAQTKATPRVDVAETPKETMELEKPECRFPVFVRTFSGTRTLYASSSMLVSDFTLLVSQSTAVLETSFYLTGGCCATKFSCLRCGLLRLESEAATGGFPNPQVRVEERGKASSGRRNIPGVLVLVMVRLGTFLLQFGAFRIKGHAGLAGCSD